MPVLRSPVLCLARAAARVFSKVKRPMNSHLFTFSDGSSLTYREFHSRLCGVLAEVGHESPGAFSSHSFRRGGTAFSFLCGVPLGLIKVLGNWESDTYLKYLEFPLETRLAASELIKIKILHRNYKY